MIELMWGKGGSGVDVWQPKCMYFHGFLNKSRDVVDKVALGKVEPRAGAVKCEGKKVWFRGRTEPDEIDQVIFATGFRASVGYLNGSTCYPPLTLHYTTQHYHTYSHNYHNNRAKLHKGLQVGVRS